MPVAAATATNAAEAAKAQAAAAAASAAKLGASQSQDDTERAQQALKKIPYVGVALAFIASHAGISGAIAAAFFLIVAPFLYPLLFSVYISFLPEKLKGAYVNIVLESFSVDDLVEKSVRETAVRFIAENNERIDFVQQFQQTWTRNGADKSPAYRFPLSDNQEFRVTLKPTQLIPVKTCQNGSTKAIAANKALNNEKLFRFEFSGKSSQTPVEILTLWVHSWQMINSGSKEALYQQTREKALYRWYLINLSPLRLGSAGR